MSGRRRGWIVKAGMVALAAVMSAPLWPAWAADAPQEAWVAPARAAKKKNPLPADAANLAAGKNVYVAQCLQCHGTAGKGDGPAAKDLQTKPGDLSNPKLNEQSDGALFWKITEGRKPMPSFEKLLAEDQRWQAIIYVRTLSPQAADGAKTN